MSSEDRPDAGDEVRRPAGDASAMSPERRRVRIRSAPRILPFLVAGALLGLIAAGIIAFTGPQPDEFSRGTVLGFFSALLLIPGLLVGGLAALAAEWLSVRRSRDAVVEGVDGEEPRQG